YIMGSRPTWGDFVQALPLMPFVLLFAAANAFAENLIFRAALLPQLLPAVGKTHALLLTAVAFALPHLPSGVTIVLLSAFLGLLLGKSMLETRGFLWAWAIQFPLDVIVFTFFAMAA
ncbi:MAG TPA: CPBP family glutamic-type intramembrane protease, partial [Symbiobacteriaceae bacterium]|nr:CPBP family glutamic-type intramembrane protease [Symbiobacteriaceae bacterium]